MTIVDALDGIRRPPAYGTRMGRLPDAETRGEFDLNFANTLATFWPVTVARRAGLPSVWAIHENVSPEEYVAYLPAPLRPAIDETLRHATYSSGLTLSWMAQTDGSPARRATLTAQKVGRVLAKTRSNPPRATASDSRPIRVP